MFVLTNEVKKKTKGSTAEVLTSQCNKESQQDFLQIHAFSYRTIPCCWRRRVISQLLS